MLSSSEKMKRKKAPQDTNVLTAPTAAAPGNLLVWRRLAPAKWADAWEERLIGISRGRMAIHTLPGGRSIRIEMYDVTPQEGALLIREFGGRVAQTPRDGWVVAAGRLLKPLAIRHKLLIVHDEKMLKTEAARLPDRAILMIPSGLAFGTGDHATTATCLRLLADEAGLLKSRPWHMLDVGCGSGILALSARLLGAASVHGFDHDPDAIRTARANAKANRIKQATFQRSSLDDMTAHSSKPFEVVAANVFSDALVASASKLARATAPGGLLIISGILRTQESETLAAFTCQPGLTTEKIIRRGKWIAASLRKA